MARADLRSEDLVPGLATAVNVAGARLPPSARPKRPPRRRSSRQEAGPSVEVAASLAAADLRGAVLDDAEIEGLDPRGARLRAAALAGAHGLPLLDGADVARADLRSEDLVPGLATAVNVAGAASPLSDPQIGRAHV